MLTVALPKGRLGDRVYELFAQIGYDCKAIYEDNRKLIYENIENDVRYLLVKPSDVAIYVERGAADIGVAGKDILLEGNPDVYELLDLHTGLCRMAVAGCEAYTEQPERTLRVATKYVNIAKNYYAGINREIEIIKLNGSIELAPILGLSDVIVDIVETGSTLRENHLRVLCDILPISARLIANKSSFQFKKEIIEGISARLEALLKKQLEEK
ncbi:MAG: ATP phosphoribosyltransferase [Hydrogenoanaerobacterium sp.]